MKKSSYESTMASSVQHIGLRYESTLHAALRDWCSRSGDILEAKVGSYIVDIVRGDQLIEIQTKNFSSIKHKLIFLLQNHRVQLVHPLIRQKWIIKVSSSDGTILSKRKSPKTETAVDIFNELIHIPNLICDPSFSLILIMIEVDEIRCDDGKGSWRRGGVSIIDRKLVDVKNMLVLNSPDEFLQFLPADLPPLFTNKTLALCAGITRRKAQKMTYCLRKMGGIVEEAKTKNELVFSRAARRESE